MSCRAVAVAALAALALSACGLPLQDGVQRPGEVAAEQRLPAAINVLPPGPQPGATPEAVVLGFLAAQSSAREKHGIARSFLAPEARAGWRDDAGVVVYDPSKTTPSRPSGEGEEVTVTLSMEVLGEVGPDGAARVQPAQTRSQTYRLRLDEARQWRLVEVPQGLTLSPADRDRSYDPLSVHFLAPQGPSAPGRHLVADLVQLPAGADRAQQVVERLLAGPSSGLAGSAESAVPLGTRLLSPVETSAAGEVTVDLSTEVSSLPDRARQDLSAQLVWSLREGVPEFTRLRLLVDGALLEVPTVGQPQPRTAWPTYAPDGPDGPLPALALVSGQLRSLDPVEEDREQTPPAAVAGAVDLASDARTDRVAVLTQDGPTRTLRTGPGAGPLAARLQDPSLSSPTWGDGGYGVFALRTGARPGVLLVPGSGEAPVVEVDAEGLPSLDDDALLRVSRDGRRVALVARGVLLVGRLEGGARPSLVGLRRMATDVLDVAWRDGTTLEVLVEDGVPPLLPLLRLSVDGTAAQATGLVGVAEGEPAAIAAYGDQPLLVETQAQGRSTIYRGDGGAGFEVALQDASRPAYPR